MYETVLWATDGSLVADGALSVALELLAARWASDRVSLRRAISRRSSSRVASVRRRGRPARKAHRQVDELKLEGVDAELLVETTHHNTAGAIARIAEACKADVIVCGSRGFGVVAGVVTGSVAMRLPHVASCPVVVVSEKATERARATTRS